MERASKHRLYLEVTGELARRGPGQRQPGSELVVGLSARVVSPKIGKIGQRFGRRVGRTAEAHRHPRPPWRWSAPSNAASILKSRENWLDEALASANRNLS